MLKQSGNAQGRLITFQSVKRNLLPVSIEPAVNVWIQKWHSLKNRTREARPVTASTEWSQPAAVLRERIHRRDKNQTSNRGMPLLHALCRHTHRHRPASRCPQQIEGFEPKIFSKLHHAQRRRAHRVINRWPVGKTRS